VRYSLCLVKGLLAWLYKTSCWPQKLFLFCFLSFCCCCRCLLSQR